MNGSVVPKRTHAYFSNGSKDSGIPWGICSRNAGVQALSAEIMNWEERVSPGIHIFKRCPGYLAEMARLGTSGPDDFLPLRWSSR